MRLSGPLLDDGRVGGLLLAGFAFDISSLIQALSWLPCCDFPRFFIALSFWLSPKWLLVQAFSAAHRWSLAPHSASQVVSTSRVLRLHRTLCAVRQNPLSPGLRSVKCLDRMIRDEFNYMYLLKQINADGRNKLFSEKNVKSGNKVDMFKFLYSYSDLSMISARHHVAFSLINQQQIFIVGFPLLYS